VPAPPIVLLRDAIRADELRCRYARRRIRCDGDCGERVREGDFYYTIDRLISAGRRCRKCARALVGTRGEGIR
jgi:hypothetical protein